MADFAGTDDNDVLIGTDEEDTFEGFAGDDTLEGRGGYDYLEGHGGDDTILGGDDGDSLFGSGGDDLLDGGSGDDALLPGSGIDTIIGGPGTDQLIYYFEPVDTLGPMLQGVVVDLALGTATDPWNFLDTFSGIENVTGSHLDDFLYGDDNENLLDGDPGNDVLFGRGGSDLLDAGGGDDTLNAGPGDDYLGAGSGNDFIDGGPGADLLSYASSIEDPAGPMLRGIVLDMALGTVTDSWLDVDTFINIEFIEATPFDDILLGDREGNVLFGGAGNDLIDGRDGVDSLLGDDGDDTLIGGEGDDDFEPGQGNDIIDGGPGHDLLYYGEGAGEVLQGVVVDLGSGTTIDGWNSIDTFSSIESVIGGELDDIIVGDDTDNNLFGGAGNDTLEGRGGNDVINGGDGDDTINAGTGDDFILGETGNDQVDGGDGFDFFALTGSRLSDYRIDESAGVITITDLNRADGDDGTDTLINIEQLGVAVSGSEGNDVISFEGTDPILGIGEEGDDLYILKNALDYAFEEPGEGDDTVQAAITRKLEPNVENLELTGEADVDGTGNELENEIIGNAGDNVLDGQAGGDILRGGSGSDTYHVDDENDQVIETGTVVTLGRFGRGQARWRDGEPLADIDKLDIADDIDQVVATISYTLTDFVENLSLAGEDAIDGSGNALDNTVLGNSSDNVLTTGTGGDDVLNGNGGNDTFVIDNRVGLTRIEDTAGGLDTLDLDAFLLTSTATELSLSAAGNTLVIRNAGSGEIQVPGFFDPATNPLGFVDVGNGPINIVGITAVAGLTGRLNGDSGSVSPLIDGEPFYQSRILSTDGRIIEAEMAQIFRQYLGGLGREPASGGYQFWWERIEDGRLSFNKAAQQFIDSPEFNAKADTSGNSTISDEEFVDHMYFNVFGRAPAESGRDFWLNSIDRSSQAVAFSNMLQSPEFVEKTVGVVSDWPFWDGIA